MRSALVALSVLLGVVSMSLAAPLVPTIVGHDINFGAEFEYKTNGLMPDTLTTTKEWLGEEATAYWPNWPITAGVTPIWFNIPGGPAVFGGDLQLDVQLFGEDAMPPHLDVSMVGTGGNGPGIADLEVWGYLAPLPNPAAVNVLLWALDLDAVSLYGYKDDVAYVLEGEGTILDCLLARENVLLGQPGAMRG
ncbi:MAG: hypothetical protein JXA69_05595, partial [Phycisphaerae bacterium]|nr:hypothetical protein [Phycisphaerae bacterium]